MEAKQETRGQQRKEREKNYHIHEIFWQNPDRQIKSQQDNKWRRYQSNEESKYGLSRGGKKEKKRERKREREEIRFIM